MLDNQQEIQKYIDTAIEIFKREGEPIIVNVLTNSVNTSAQQTCYDNWNGGQYYYTIYIIIPISISIEIKNLDLLENKIREKINFLLRQHENLHIENVVISPETNRIIKWEKIASLYSKQELLDDIVKLRGIMIEVATGKQKIQNINDSYKSQFDKIQQALILLGLENPNSFIDLWDWYKYWSNSENKLPTYASRRTYINNLFKKLFITIEESTEQLSVDVAVDLSDWERVKRSVGLIKSSVVSASSTEEFQTIGVLCRETIISLGQAVFNSEKHDNATEIKISKTDAKRMLKGFISVELQGGSNEYLRKYANASLDLANNLTHKRTASLKDASICIISTFSLINLIGIMDGKHYCF